MCNLIHAVQWILVDATPVTSNMRRRVVIVVSTSVELRADPSLCITVFVVVPACVTAPSLAILQAADKSQTLHKLFVLSFAITLAVIYAKFCV